MGSWNFWLLHFNPVIWGWATHKCHRGGGKCPSWAGKSRAAHLGFRAEDSVTLSEQPWCCQDTSMQSVGGMGWQPTLGIGDKHKLYSPSSSAFFIPCTDSLLTLQWERWGFVHCWLHVAKGTISASSKPSIKSGLGAKQAQETLLNLLSQESLAARKDALMGTLHSQAKLPLESLPPLCQLIKP